MFSLPLFVIFGELFGLVLCMGLPEYMKSCSRNDPQLNKCALEAAKVSLQKFSLGDPSRGILPLDPLYVPEIVVYVPNENGLKVTFKENYFAGLSKLSLESLKFDLDKKQISADALVTLDVQNKYDLSGKLLVVSVKSSGDSSINLKNALLHIKFWYEHIIADDGKVHWNIIKHDIKYEVEKASFRLENLLNNKEIGEQINKLLNEFWRDIVSEVGPSISKSLCNAVVSNLRVLLEQVPYDELMPES